MYPTIFGNTYNGVPNPYVAVEKGYPTRYHGTVLSIPQLGYRYQPQTYAKAPYVGFGDDSKMETLFGESATGSRLWDTLLGAATGYLGASHGQELMFCAAGAGASLLGGWRGLAVAMGAAVALKIARARGMRLA